MTKVFCTMAASVDGFVTGRNPRPGNGLGDGGDILHDWYWNGDQPSAVGPDFHLFEPSSRVFESVVARTGAVVSGRTTYEDSGGWGGGKPHPTAALFVVSHRPAPPEATAQQHFVGSVEQAIAEARTAAGDLDVNLMGGRVLTEALTAGLVDEIIVHQVSVLLGGGRPLFQELPAQVRLTLVEAVPAPGVTHLHYQVER